MEEKGRIIQAEKSVIVAADVSSFEELKHLVKAVKGIPEIGGFKIGFRMAFKDIGLAVNIVRVNYGSDVPIIYDHQKAGNDIPDMGRGFAEDLKVAGVTAAILFPFTGPITQEVWTSACFNAGLQVLTGGMMTHPRFLVSEGGYIDSHAPEKIFKLACRLGVKHFVVPGNKLTWVRFLRRVLVRELGEGNFVLYAPGFITQKGDISECGQAAGDEWHAIVGSAIYKAKKMRKAAIAVTQQIR